MSEFRLPYPASVIAGKACLSAEDLSTLRRTLFPHGLRTYNDAITLLALNITCPKKCDEWPGYFLEAMTDFVVRYSYPPNALDDVNVAWLIRMLSSDGAVRSALELELVLSIIDASGNVPPELSVFALEQLRIALTDGTGAYRQARPIHRQGVTVHDLAFIRFVLRTAYDHGQLALTRLEIAVLERIDQATLPGENHPDWAPFIAGIRPRRGDDGRDWRWLRVPDAMFRRDAVA